MIEREWLKKNLVMIHRFSKTTYIADTNDDVVIDRERCITERLRILNETPRCSGLRKKVLNNQ